MPGATRFPRRAHDQAYDKDKVQEGQIKSVEDSGGVSPTEADAEFRRDEARYAEGWYQSITSDMFG